MINHLFEYVSRFSDFLNLFRIIWDVSGGHHRPLEATFVNILKILKMVSKVSGKVQEGPRSPQDPLKSYVGCHENAIV